MSETLDQLTGAVGRTKVHDAAIVVKLPKAAKEAVGRAAGDLGVGAASVVRTALAEYLERRGYLQ